MLSAPADSPKIVTVAGVAAEARDVLLNPTEGADLVERTAIGDAVFDIQESLGAGAIVDGHAHDAVARELGAVIPGTRARSVVLEEAAGNPDHHRLVGRPEITGPDVEGQAVLAGADELGEDHRHHRGIG